MKRTVLVVWTAVLMTLVLSGCWSRKELNELAVSIGLGIDQTENGYLVTTQIVAPRQAASGAGGANGPPALVMATEESTVIEALRKLTTKLPRKIYLSHLSILLIDESIAREGCWIHLIFCSGIMRCGPTSMWLSSATALHMMPCQY